MNRLNLSLDFALPTALEDDEPASQRQRQRLDAMHVVSLPAGLTSTQADWLIHAVREFHQAIQPLLR